jgi:hypothetical protein
MFDVIGLMTRQDEKEIIRQAAGWLDARGCIVLDCPEAPDKLKTEMKRQMDDGELEIRSIYNPATRHLHIRPRFFALSGEIIELRDNYADPAEKTLGIRRYLYTREELVNLLREADFDVDNDLISPTRGNITLVGRRSR